MRSNNSIYLTSKLPSAGNNVAVIGTLAALFYCITTSAANNLRSTSHRRSKDNKENIAQNTQRLLQETTFRCPEHYTGHYPTSDCKSYYWCSDGAVAGSFLNSCNDGMLFDVQKERCDWGTNVDCNDTPYDPNNVILELANDPNNVILELANGVTVSAQIGEPIYFPDFSRLQCIGEKEGDEKPSWMTSQHLFKSKERCCIEHFSWLDLNKCLGDDFVEMNYLLVSATERPTTLPTSPKEDSVQGLDLDVIQVPAQPSTSEQANESETPCEIINCERICDMAPHFSKDGTYITYDRVIAEDDALYECLEPRGSSKCSAEGYEPGSGLYWVTAWKMIFDSLGCLPEPTSQLTNEPTVETTNGLEDMTNWTTPLVLNNEETTSRPTPTSKPTTEPTIEPTSKPSYKLTTLMPTQPLWHINYDLRTCVSDGKQPSWIKEDELYISKELCCSKYYDFESHYSACIAQTQHPTLQPTTGRPTSSPTTPYPTTPPTLAGIQCAPPYTVGHPYKFMEEISFNGYNYACYVPDLCRDAQYAPRLSDDNVGKAWWKTDECVGMQTRHPTPLPTASPTTKQPSTNNPTLESLELVPSTQTLKKWHVDYILRTCVINNKQFGWIEEDELYISKEQCCRNHFDNVRTYYTCITDGIETRHGDNYPYQSKEVLHESEQADDALSDLGQPTPTPTPTPFLRSLPPIVRPTSKLTLEPTQLVSKDENNT